MRRRSEGWLSDKGPSYYVSSAYGNDGNVGAYDTPLKTLGAAITKIGNNVGYIYIQDYNELTSTITVPSERILHL